MSFNQSVLPNDGTYLLGNSNFTYAYVCNQRPAVQQLPLFYQFLNFVFFESIIHHFTKIVSLSLSHSTLASPHSISNEREALCYLLPIVSCVPKVYIVLLTSRNSCAHPGRSFRPVWLPLYPLSLILLRCNLPMAIIVGDHTTSIITDLPVEIRSHEAFK